MTIATKMAPATATRLISSADEARKREVIECLLSLNSSNVAPWRGVRKRGNY
jgi:pectin methylesterase-like acyl-CoA thioesterase